MKHYLSSSENVMKELEVSAEGLNSAQIAERQQKYGPNKLKEAEKDSWFKKFMGQLKDPMTIILLAAAAISAVTAYIGGEGFADVFIILFVVIMNAVLGVYQESKAEAAIEALQQISAATSKVLRNGVQSVVKSEELVPGDIILLEAGDAVPADARIIEAASLKAEEAALTGESVPVNKHSDIIEAKESEDIPLGDRKNMLYMGSSVAYGRAKAVVVATGMDTEMGKIAQALTMAKDDATPLQLKMGELSKKLSVIVLAICAIIFGVNIIRNWSTGITGTMLLDTFMVAVSLAVAAIPEGLSAVVTILLSMGVTKMSNNKAIIRRLTAVETLGSTQIICSDKTGTLTQNKMTVVEVRSDDQELHRKAMALCSDSELDENFEAVGEATENALVNDAYKYGFDKRDLKVAYPRIGEAPFDSDRKMMSTLHKNTEGKIVQFTKGAPDEIIKRCTKIILDGQVVEMTKQIKEHALIANKHMADQALRVLAVAYKEYDVMPEFNGPAEIEEDLIYIGLSGMIDPIRPEVKDAVEECRKAGIRPIMITGDHKDTAVAIAKQLGILGKDQKAITGAELSQISDEELERDIELYSVYARVQPEHKTRIVSAWQKKGMIVAMTGDGVNDAPSIKTADIGVGMGITGTDVTKNVADMVLADDNFATIVSAAAEGRRIYDNIRKTIQFLLSTNVGEVLVVFISSLIGITVIEPAHLLWINLVTDSLPAMALGMEEAEANNMSKPPRPSDESIFADGMTFAIGYQGVIITCLVLISFLFGRYMETGLLGFGESAHGVTMAFLTLSMAEMFHSINMRSRTGSAFKMPHKNKYLLGALIFTFVSTLLAIYVPFLNGAFGFTRVPAGEAVIAVGIALLLIPIVEIIKAIQRK